MGRIRNQYVLAITGFGSNLWIADLVGIAHSPDRGRVWHEDFTPPPCAGQGCVNRARAFLLDSRSQFWVGTELGLFRFGFEFAGWGGRDSVACGSPQNHCHEPSFAVTALADAAAATSEGLQALRGGSPGVRCLRTRIFACMQN